eukprot:TRINITY_DN2778_c0_g2_i1.p1 TRINITY_DN2778_c0_g2~~TRINITY_DN2778_c0_g2_i1.p1  ORF type:complete len:279 (-),score=49.01 TRINITY_DN2778_c0_g2_i1:6-842(-)
MKRKTNAAKKSQKRKERMKQQMTEEKDILEEHCNSIMTCNSCGRDQKNRAFCYFCGSIQRLPSCGNCGKFKCITGGSNDCLIRHPGRNVTGMELVGAICDICEAWICHSKKCILKHTCPCPLEGAVCIECEREIWDHGGRMYKCGTCSEWLCQDDAFEHQASCEVLEGESFKCRSCNKLGVWACLRCKICYCDDHVLSAITRTLKSGDVPPCKKCHYPLKETKSLSMSTKSYEYGRHGNDGEETSGYYGYQFQQEENFVYQYESSEEDFFDKFDQIND